VNKTINMMLNYYQANNYSLMIRINHIKTRIYLNHKINMDQMTHR